MILSTGEVIFMCFPRSTQDAYSDFIATKPIVEHSIPVVKVCLNKFGFIVNGIHYELTDETLEGKRYIKAIHEYLEGLQ